MRAAGCRPYGLPVVCVVVARGFVLWGVAVKAAGLPRRFAPRNDGGGFSAAVCGQP